MGRADPPARTWFASRVLGRAPPPGRQRAPSLPFGVAGPVGATLRTPPTSAPFVSEGVRVHVIFQAALDGQASSPGSAIKLVFQAHALGSFLAESLHLGERHRLPAPRRKDRVVDKDKSFRLPWCTSAYCGHRSRWEVNRTNQVLFSLYGLHPWASSRKATSRLHRILSPRPSSCRASGTCRLRASRRNRWAVGPAHLRVAAFGSSVGGEAACSKSAGNPSTRSSRSST